MRWFLYSIISINNINIHISRRLWRKKMEIEINGMLNNPYEGIKIMVFLREQ